MNRKKIKVLRRRAKEFLVLWLQSSPSERQLRKERMIDEGPISF